MKTELRTPTIELSDSQRSYVKRRVRTVLGRFADTIERVEVTIEDLNGPRGGVDQRCVVQVFVAGEETVVAEHTHERFHGAVALAARRAGRSVARRRNRAARSGTWGRREALRTAS